MGGSFNPWPDLIYVWLISLIMVMSQWPSWRPKSPALKCLCNRLFKLISKKTSKPASLALCENYDTYLWWKYAWYLHDCTLIWTFGLINDDQATSHCLSQCWHISMLFHIASQSLNDWITLRIGNTFINIYIYYKFSLRFRPTYILGSFIVFRCKFWKFWYNYSHYWIGWLDSFLKCMASIFVPWYRNSILLLSELSFNHSSQHVDVQRAPVILPLLETSVN